MMTPDLTQSQSALELLQHLISIPSVNPDIGGHQTFPPSIFGEQQIATSLKPFLEACGFAVTLEEVLPGRPNLIARAPGSNERPRVLFGPHLDTVGVEHMVIPPFEPTISEGKLWGRGTSDTKGPMASMLWALKENAEALATAPVALDFVGFMGEETTQLGSKDFAQKYGTDYEFAIVGEPTNLRIVHCTKGSLWVELSAQGRSAHASQPHLGENAIMKLYEGFAKLTPRLDQAFAEMQHPVLGKPTWNLGLFSGGTQPNVVADHAKLSLDIRTTPKLWQQGGALQLVEQELPEGELSITKSHENPPMEVSPEHPWIEKIQSIHPSASCVGAPWFSDAAHLNEAGLASICLGPGSIDQAHTEDEFILIEDFQQGVEFFTVLIEQFCHNS